MATITQNAARVAYSKSGNSPKITHYPEAISQDFKRGALLFLSASGTCKILPANAATAGFDQANTRILGLAAADANDTTSPTEEIPVYEANSDTVFLTNVISTTSDATASIDAALFGQAGSASVTSSRCFFDVTGSAAASNLRCVGFKDVSGDKFGRVLFQVLVANRLSE